MRTDKDVEAYLLRLDRRFRAVDDQPGTFLVESGGGLPPVAVRVEPPVVLVRVVIGTVQEDGGSPALLRTLLERNARQLVHASYGLDGGRIVLSSALQLENLDFNEVQATLDEIDMVLADPLPELSSLNADVAKTRAR